MDDARNYHALATATGGDIRKLHKLFRASGSWARAYRRFANTLMLTSLKDPAQLWCALKESGIHLMLRHEPDFPRSLLEIPQPPFGLYYKGRLPQPHETHVAIVGTRRATPEGKSTAQRFARELARTGCIIVSGLAFGIDAAAHQGCLEANARTIAVLAGGLERTYPREHDRLAQEILSKGGALISEYPPGCPPYKDRFVERNRLISGLSLATLIIEAPEGSGALATARTALEANRDVFVIPGSIANPNYAGSHALIRSGATLVAAPEDIIEALGLESHPISDGELALLSHEEQRVIGALVTLNEAADVDKIATITRLEPRIVNRTLSFLVLKNVAKEADGKYTI